MVQIPLSLGILIFVILMSGFLWLTFMILVLNSMWRERSSNLRKRA